MQQRGPGQYVALLVAPDQVGDQRGVGGGADEDEHRRGVDFSLAVAAGVVQTDAFEFAVAEDLPHLHLGQHADVLAGLDPVHKVPDMNFSSDSPRTRIVTLRA